MATTNQQQLKPCIELFSNGIKKLETFFKVASTKEETAFIEIDPSEDVIKLNCLDPAHITRTIHIITDEDGDFNIIGLDKILQFNVNVKDFNKMLTVAEGKELKIFPDIDNNNKFDALRIQISENNVTLKDIFLPIHGATNSDLFDGTIQFVDDMIHKKHNVIKIGMDLEFMNEILKESEIFQNERLMFNVTIQNKSLSSLSVETFDSDTDKTRRIRTNLFEGLHFQVQKINVPDSEKHQYNVLVSFPDLKKLIVTSKIFSNLQILIGDKNPIVILYDMAQSNSSVVNTLVSMLAPITREEDLPQDNT